MPFPSRATMAGSFGQYELLERLAHGGMGEVFLARVRREDGFEKLVALKRILPQYGRDERFRARFAEEARRAARLRHGHIVQVFDFGRLGDESYLSMEYVDGTDVAALIRAWPHGLPPPCALEIGVALFKALDYLRRVSWGPVVHRDISPQNILVGREGEVKLTDFGIAAAARHGAVAADTAGKLGYMAPEQIAGEAVDPRADLFAAGIVLFEMFTGVSPFGTARDSLDPRRRDEALHDALRTHAPTLISRAHELPELLLKLWAPDPHHRPASAREVLDRLETMGRRAHDLAPDAPSLADLACRVGDRPPADPTRGGDRTRTAAVPIRSAVIPATSDSPLAMVSPGHSMTERQSAAPPNMVGGGLHPTKSARFHPGGSGHSVANRQYPEPASQDTGTETHPGAEKPHLPETPTPSLGDTLFLSQPRGVPSAPRAAIPGTFDADEDLRQSPTHENIKDTDGFPSEVPSADPQNLHPRSRAEAITPPPIAEATPHSRFPQIFDARQSRWAWGIIAGLVIIAGGGLGVAGLGGGLTLGGKWGANGGRANPTPLNPSNTASTPEEAVPQQLPLPPENPGSSAPIDERRGPETSPIPPRSTATSPPHGLREPVPTARNPPSTERSPPSPRPPSGRSTLPPEARSEPRIPTPPADKPPVVAAPTPPDEEPAHSAPADLKPSPPPSDSAPPPPPRVTLQLPSGVKLTAGSPTFDLSGDMDRVVRMVFPEGKLTLRLRFRAAQPEAGSGTTPDGVEEAVLCGADADPWAEISAGDQRSSTPVARLIVPGARRGATLPITIRFRGTGTLYTLALRFA